jgi:hypothetical protein
MYIAFDQVPTFLHPSYPLLLANDAQLLALPIFNVTQEVVSASSYIVDAIVDDSTLSSWVSLSYNSSDGLLWLTLANSSAFEQLRTGFTFNLTVTQTRPQCNLASSPPRAGPCFVKLTISPTVIMPEPGLESQHCPDLIVYEYSMKRWNGLYWNTSSMGLGHTISALDRTSGSIFPIGKTVVQYLLTGIPSAQPRLSSIVCSFEVC